MSPRIIRLFCLFSCWPTIFTPNICAAVDVRPNYYNAICDGRYGGHLQGIAVDGQGSVFWSFTEQIVKTDASGRLVKVVTVPSHQGDLAYWDGRLYCAVNLGQFNQEEGKADSWIWTYDPTSLEIIGKHRVAEVVHGAGGVACRDGHYFVVGGLPESHSMNYVYEYDGSFRFIARHDVPSGYTQLGIQTACFADGYFWFGCYGKSLLKTDTRFQLVGRFDFDCALGITGIGDGRMLIGRQVGKDRLSGQLIRFDQSAEASGALTPVGQASLPRSHAHNDYYHDRPLTDSLNQGFSSVEVDIFLSEGRLLVGHSARELKAERTLESLYLDPLRERIEANDGRVHRDGAPFTLLIDIKTDGKRTYQQLKQVLGDYKDIVSGQSAGNWTPRAVEVVISGNRAFQMIENEANRLVGIDGRLSDLGSGNSRDLLPMISDNWRKHFSWRGERPIAANERNRLRKIVQQAHNQGRRVRFWATPENPSVWTELLDAGVDLIGTDDLQLLHSFVRER